MKPTSRVEPAAPGRRCLQAIRCAALAAFGLLGCSVYDASLLGSDSLPISAAGNGGQPPDLGIGGSLVTRSGGASGAGFGGSAGSVVSAGGAAPEQSGSAGTSDEGGAGGTGDEGGFSGSAGGNAGAAVGGGAGTAGSSGAAGSAPTLHELAKGKKVTASTTQTGNEPNKGNDGDATSRWCAIDKTFPQWWRVDLGAAHELTQVSIQFEHPERTYTYVIETSPNDAVYTQRAMVNGTGATQTVDMPADVTARYVRVTITNGVPYGTTWGSFYELELFGY